MSADVMLNSGEALVGSFTVDGMTYAVNGDGGATLVAVSPNVILSDGEAGVEGSLSIPQNISYAGAIYPVTAIGPYAFYLSSATQVELPVSIVDIDERAFRSSDVAWADVLPGNPNLASYDGIVYDATLTRLLLIPGGRQGAVRIASNAEEVDASVFSHCAGVDAISVDAGSADFASWDGLLYDATGQTLLRVPAGAVEITIREGCTTIASGAMAGCAKLERINAPSTVTSISPDVFESVPTIGLPALTLQDESVAASFMGAESEESAEGATLSPVILSGGEAEVEGSNERETEGSPQQLTAMMALSTDEDPLLGTDPASIQVLLADDADALAWTAIGFAGDATDGSALAELGSASSYRAVNHLKFDGNGGAFTRSEDSGALSILDWFDDLNVYVNGIYLDNGLNLHYTLQNAGCTFRYWSSTSNGTTGFVVRTFSSGSETYYAIFDCPITWNANGGYWNNNPSDTANKSNTWTSNTAASGYGGSAVPQRLGYRFTGWKSSVTGAVTPVGSNVPVLWKTTYTAQWVSDYTIHFDGNVVDDEAHPATVPVNMPAAWDQARNLPSASRFGYIFKGWATHPSGSTSGGNQVFAPGESVMNLTDTSGDTVTLYALWALKYDADVPVGTPSGVTFALDSTNTGAVKAVPADYAGDFSPADMDAMGSTHECAIESRMAVPVAVASVSAEPISEDAFAKVLSSTDGSAADQQLSFAISSDDAGATLKAGESAELAGLFVPEASEGTPVAQLPIDYGLELAETAVVLEPDEEAAVPVANVCYTLDVIEGMAYKWGFFIDDGGTPVPPTRIKEAAEAIAADDDGSGGSSSPWYDVFHDYLEDDVRGYVAWGDGTTYPVRIIGINHDDKSDGSGKAGLTFQFVDCLNTPYHFNPTNTNAGGWGASELRRELNAEAGEIRKQIPDRLDNLLVPVTKRYFDGPTGLGATLRSSEDVLFLLSYFEITSRDARTFGGYSLMKNEGSIYAYYGPAGLDVSGAVNQDCMRRFTQNDKQSPVLWWQRSCWTDVRTQFCLVDWDGNVNGCLPAADPTINSYACPCFCL